MSSFKKDKFLTVLVIALFIALSCLFFFYGRDVSFSSVKNIFVKSNNTSSLFNFDLTEKQKADLNKRLSDIDSFLKLPELRIVSPQSPLEEGYTANLKALPPKYSNFPNKERLVDATCYDAFISLLDSARAIDIDIYIYSSYRSYADQKKLYDEKLSSSLKSGMTSSAAAVAAAKKVAYPGTSEHQYGFSADIGNGKEYEFNAIKNTTTYGWLKDNAHNYGFILRYPEGTSKITGMEEEPWHFRYVGAEHAKYIYENNITLEEYITRLKNEQADIKTKLKIK